MNYLACYKGPAKKPLAKIFHYVVCVWTLSRYSHCELVIDGWAYSSSSRDGGVRKKKIDFNSGHWDLVPLPYLDAEYVLNFYEKTRNHKYDYLGLFGFVLPFIPHSTGRWFCSEWCGKAQKYVKSHRLHIQHLYKKASLDLQD